ncbi:MAG: N-6 DNA methylase [Deltaproteobacteria bacterium]|nr:N-6 DNA methylase [Deltaproteobacteria bacterium]
MTPDPLDRIRSIRDIPALIAYLRDELDWPIEADDFDKFTFDYEPEELGIDASTATQIEEIKQLRPLVSNQPWGIFFIRFEPKRLPVVVLRRILSQLVVRKRASASKSDLATWNLHDLLFISNYGEDDQRQITFAHFTQDATSGDLPTLKVLGWDDAATALHISNVHHELKEKLHWPENEKDLDSWRERWSSAFTLRHRQVITTSKDLAIRLADLARRIRRRAGQVLAVETERGPLRKLHKAFRAALIHDLSEDDFADMYAQTIAYGLLAARVSRPMGIIAENVTDMVPVTNPFLREMLGTFLTIGGRKGKMDFDELGIQDVVDLLNSPDTHMEAILRDFGNRTRQEDPVIHFYELFLAEYDKKMKVKRGVFYTPQPVVSYIVRSVHELLQTEFGLADGLADTTTWGEMAKRNPAIKIPEGVSEEEPFVQILDVATGTATFLVEVIDIIHKTMTAKWEREKRLELEFDRLWNEYVPKHLLPRLYGYELMMAPYAIAHMKIGLKLFETGYRFGSNERAHVYLTNALEPPSILAEQAAANLFEALGHEAQAVNAIKSNKRFTVIIGNPPYSNLSANLSPELRVPVEKYKFIDEERIRERGALSLEKNINDDYVKFVRYAQLAVQQMGIYGLVTNNGFMANPTLRGMRYSLINSFPKFYILNLLGYAGTSTRRMSETPDVNIFDIANAGVAIHLGCRGPKEHAFVGYAEMIGSREAKYRFLSDHTVQSTPFVSVNPELPFFLMEPTDTITKKEYETGMPLLQLFKVNSTGIRTLRDDFVVDFEEKPILDRVSRFRDSNASDKDLCGELGLEMPGWWNIAKSRQSIRRESGPKQFIRLFNYRPFDVRRLFYHDSLVGSPRRPIMQHMEPRSKNLALHICRQLSSPTWQHVFITRGLTDDCYVSNRTKERGYTLPLYLTSATGQLGLGDIATNFNLEFFKNKLPHEFSEASEKTILYYVYCILFSPSYRCRYSDFLKRDFPCLPLTSSIELFNSLAELGSELVALHLVEAPVQTGISIQYDKIDGWTFAYTTPPPVCIAFAGPAEPVVDKVGWSDSTVWINAIKPKKGATDIKVTGTVGFRGVPEEVWNFHIGGYQVCQKWLKDRKGRTLGADDLVHYHRIVVALHETIRLMAEIDRVIDAHGGWPIK